MNNKDTIINIITIVSIIVALFGGYYLGNKDSFAMSCIRQGKTAIIIDNKQMCISQNFTYDLCQPKISNYFLDLEMNNNG